MLQEGETKICSKCMEVKGLSEFYRRGSRYSSACKACKREYARKWREENRDLFNQRQRDRVRAGKCDAKGYTRAWKLRNRFALALGQVNSRARMNGYVECTARAEDVAFGYSGLCHICGRKRKRLILDHNKKTGEFRGWLCDKCKNIISFIEEGDLVCLIDDYINGKGTKHQTSVLRCQRSDLKLCGSISCSKRG
jgi:hypothetical protein